MDTGPYAEHMTAFQKMTLQNFKSGFILIQSQTEDILNRMLDQARWIPEEYRSPLEKWQNFSARELDLTATYIDDVFSIYESMVLRPKKKSAPKTRAGRKNEGVNTKPKMEVKNEP